MHYLFKRSAALALCGILIGVQPSAVSHAAQNSIPPAGISSEQSVKKNSEDMQTEESKDSSSNSEETSSNTTGESEDTAASATESKDSSSDTTVDDSEESNTNTSEKSEEGNSAKSPKEDPSASTKEKTKSTSSSKKEKSKDSNKLKETKEKEIKKLDETIISEEDSAEKDEEPEAIVPKIYGVSDIITKDNVEYMGNYIYFNQGDSAWNQNGYRIAAAGCGPTSMAIVISSLTKQWVTPIDTAVWGYEHGYYSAAGSAHEMIPAMAEAYGLKCKGVGTNYNSIKKALKKGKPVIALMGPGYFTRKGHFMVLIDIDKNDNVTVADVASRARSSYKYALSDIISQSKNAGAGGPFWIISKPKTKKSTKNEVSSPAPVSPKTDYVLYFKDETSVKHITYHLGDQVSYYGEIGIITSFDHRHARIRGKDGTYLKNLDNKGKNAIPLSELTLIRQASDELHKAVSQKKLNTIS